MNSANDLYQTLYIVFDNITRGIFFATHNSRLAYAVKMSSVRINTKPAGYGTGGFIKPDQADVNLNNPGKNLKLVNRYGLEFPELMLDPEEMQDFSDFKKKVFESKQYHERLIKTSDMAQEHSMAVNPLIVKYFDSIIYELSQCDPASGVFTDAIKNYAEESGCTPAVAVSEFNMMVDSVNNSRLRNLAMYERFRCQMSTAFGDVEKMESIIKDAGQSFYMRASV
jgi:hypothetical protein